MNGSIVSGSVDNPQGTRGWLVGNFLPEGNPYKTRALEIAWKKMGPRDKDPVHIHNMGTEVIIVMSGRIDFLVENEEGKLEPLAVSARNYLMVKPGAMCGIENVYEGTEVIMVKTPSEPSDKETISGLFGFWIGDYKRFLISEDREKLKREFSDILEGGGIATTIGEVSPEEIIRAKREGKLVRI